MTETNAFKEFANLLSKSSILQDIINFRNNNLEDYIEIIREEVYEDIFKLTKNKIIISDLQLKYINNQNIMIGGATK